jgi:TatD DNase family protein
MLLGYIKDGLRSKSYKIPLTCSNHLGDNGSATDSRRGQWSVKLIDTHAHLDEIDDLERALMRAKEAGVRAIIGVGMDLASNEKMLMIASRYAGFVYPALGLHPWRLNPDELEDNLALIERELSRCVAMGEIGLDFALKTPQDYQIKVFQRLLDLASQMKKPVLLHARRAWAEALSLVKNFKIRKAVFHWYSGPADVLQSLFAEGYFISATPAAAYSERHRRAIQAAPMNQLLLETDAPEVYRGNPSEPQDLLTTLQAVSELKGRDPREIADQTFLNGRDFFQLSLP